MAGYYNWSMSYNALQAYEEKKQDQEIKARCIYLEWSGTRKHPKATEYEAIGVIKGNWFFLPNGKKKSITANGFKVLEEY